MNKPAVHYDLTMAQSVEERLLDPALCDNVTVSEMMDAYVAAGLAYSQGEIDASTCEEFYELIKQSFRTRWRNFPERQELVAWVEMEEAESRLPKSAMSEMVN